MGGAIPARCASIWYMNVYFCDIYRSQPRHAFSQRRVRDAPVRPNLISRFNLVMEMYHVLVLVLVRTRLPRSIHTFFVSRNSEITLAPGLGPLHFLGGGGEAGGNGGGGVAVMAVVRWR